MKSSIRLILAACVLAAVVLIFGCGSKKTAVNTAHKPSEPTKQTAATPKATKIPAAQAPAAQPPFSLPGMDQPANPLSARPPAAVKPAPVIGPAKRPTAAVVLAVLQNVYRSMTTLKSQGSSITVSKMDGKKVGKPKRIAITVLFARPDKLVIGNDDGRLVTDGKVVYNYLPAAKQYVKGKMSSDLIKGLITARPGINVMGLLYGVDYQKAIASSKLLPDTRLGAREVYVLSLRLKSGVGSPKGTSVAQTLWIGKRDMGLYKTLTLISMRPKAPKGTKGKFPKLVESAITTNVSSFQPNAKLPASTFAFKPPAGAKLYEQPKPVDLSGKAAPDFSFQWIDGQTKKLSDFRGKAVLLDFIGLPMCDPQLPVLQGVSEKLKDRAQLIVVDVDKDSAKVREHLKKKGYNFPVVFLDATSAKVIGEGYHIMGLPTMFFIDEKGLIQAQVMGVPTEKDIEAKLNKIGAH